MATFKIAIELSVEKISMKREWEVQRQDADGTRHYDYTPEIPHKETESRTVYTQVFNCTDQKAHSMIAKIAHIINQEI